MRVIRDGGEAIDLGITDATPTITLVDYSRRETDDFGVTTVVERGFARRMAVKLVVPFDQAAALRLTLADLRATTAQWVADERFAWLNFRGFYKDFEIDLAVPPVSYCNMTVEGLASTEPFVDTGEDPAPNGDASSLQLVQPITITDNRLVSLNVPEDDYPEWSGGTAYPVGARVIKAATHRIYESGSANNLGNDPVGISGKWTDIGPTNRWAMFDQALGSETVYQNVIIATISASAVDAVALLDVTNGANVRVQASGYDRSKVAASGATLTFLDLPGSAGQVTVTISGPGLMSVGTLLVGALVGLGSTMESPKSGITDYSRKEADEFGAPIVVERAWAKRMSLNAMIRTDAIDLVAGRIAAVRAKPSLWIGKEGLDAVTAYGFFKDFSIEVGPNVSNLGLTIEGLSTAGKVEPLLTSVDWPSVQDPLGTKPQDNATHGAPGDTPVGTSTASAVVADLRLNGQNWFDLARLEGIRDALMMARTTLEGKPIGTVVSERTEEFRGNNSAAVESFRLLGAKSGDGTSYILNIDTVQVGPVGGTGPMQSLAQRFNSISGSLGGVTGSIKDLRTILIDESGLVSAKAVLALDVNGRVAGMVATNTGRLSSLELLFDSYNFLTPDGNSIFSYSPIAAGGDGKVHMPDVVVRSLELEAVGRSNIKANSVTDLNSMSFPDVPIVAGEGEKTVAEAPDLLVGDSLDGKALVLFSYTQDGTSQVDSGIILRAYVDTGAGYQMVRSRPSGIRSSGGDTQWILTGSFPIAVMGGGNCRVKVTAQSTAIGSGSIKSSWLRDMEFDIFFGAR